jgi:hypothetical protein
MYFPTTKINSVNDLQVGDIVQIDPTDSVYDRKVAKYIQKIDSANDKVIIQDLVWDDLNRTFYFKGAPTTQSIFSNALVRDYPYIIGHAQGTIPSQVLVGSGEGSRSFVWNVYPYES